MQLSDDFIKDVELQYLRLVSEALKKGDMDITTAKSSAQEFLKLLPFAHMDDMKLKLQQYCMKYPAISSLTVYIMQKMEESKTSDVLEKMRTLMKSNQIDDALKLAQ